MTTLTGEKLPCELSEVVDDCAEDERIIESGRESELGEMAPCRYTSFVAGLSSDCCRDVFLRIVRRFCFCPPAPGTLVVDFDLSTGGAGALSPGIAAGPTVKSQHCFQDSEAGKGRRGARTDDFTGETLLLPWLRLFECAAHPAHRVERSFTALPRWVAEIGMVKLPQFLARETIEAVC